MAASIKIDWWKVIGLACAVCLAGAILWGAYSFYFCKPTPIVQTYYVQPQQGGSVNMNTGVTNKASKGKFFTGIYGNKDTIGAVVGWLW